MIKKSIVSFPNGFGIGSDNIVPLVFIDLIKNPNGNEGLNCFESLTMLLNHLWEDKVTKSLGIFLEQRISPS